MSKTAVVNKLGCLVESVVKILCLIHCKHRRKLLVSKFFAELYALDFAYQHFCSLRHVKSSHLSDNVRRLSHYLSVERAVNNNSLADFLSLLSVKEVSSSVCKFCLKLLVYLVKDNRRLLGSAYHTVVKSLGMKYRRRSHLDICRIVDYRRSVACAYANCRFA